MSLSSHTGLTIAGQTLRALRRYPERIAFSSEVGTITYAGASDLIGRIQSVFRAMGLSAGNVWRFSPIIRRKVGARPLRRKDWV